MAAKTTAAPINPKSMGWANVHTLPMAIATGSGEACQPRAATAPMVMAARLPPPVIPRRQPAKTAARPIPNNRAKRNQTGVFRSPTQTKPTTMPPPSPNRSSMGARRRLATRLMSPWPPNTRLKQMPKPVMEITSSKLAAARTMVGIPFATPYPRSCKSKRLGTTTAGDTAAITKPNNNPQSSGKPNRRCEITETVNASARFGKNARRKKAPCKRHKASRLRPKPARSRITVRASRRKATDQFSGNA